MARADVVLEATAMKQECSSELDIQDYPESDLKGLRVLVVEDDEDARVFFTHVLSACGAEVRSAASTWEAMQAIGGFHPDVLVSDLAMPGEDGYKLIRRVRFLPRERGGLVPALAVTGLTEPEQRARALWAGFQTVMRKPVAPEELVGIVAALAGRIEEPDLRDSRNRAA